MSTPSNQVMDQLAETGFVCGQGTAIRSVNAVVADIARTDIPVLLVGESGTGKEIYARLIHRLSGFSDPSLKKLSCRTIDPSRLLGQFKKNLRLANEECGTGTLFLDRVQYLDLPSHPPLLSSLPHSQLNIRDH